MTVTLRANKGSALAHSELDANFSDFMILTGTGAGRSLSGLRAGYLESNIPNGSSPLLVASSTVCTNLNADLLDGQHASAFVTNGKAIAMAMIFG